MARLTVELEERELARLRSAARARQIDPSHMTTMQLVQVLTDAQPKKKTSWLAGAAARMRPHNTALYQAIPAGVGKHPVEILEQQHRTAVAVSGIAAAPAAARAQRLAAVMSMHGIWKDDPTKPQDGAEYQREVRAEWR
ncbi:hypothetical protein [Rugamonas sp. DEMB1]|uniref:hypothetical protein n=1 Tax=Rugamonas sp. DEMB1 TaxID=3039386 RepID=UPI00244A9AF9|nr:hypothetical protein [Rugamonas sp. DEMB1]WGG51200.1 hypothetical protein QC826_02615 [Rugamonas sp. DEMB1]